MDTNTGTPGDRAPAPQKAPPASPKMLIMLASYGRAHRVEDVTCGSCAHLDTKGGRRRCTMARGGAKYDWSPLWPACGAYSAR